MSDVVGALITEKSEGWLTDGYNSAGLHLLKHMHGLRFLFALVLGSMMPLTRDRQITAAPA